jgi:hypothetical protein
MKGKGARLYATVIKCSGLSGRRKTHVHPTETAPTELGVARGRSRAFGFVPALGKVHPGFGRWCRREDLCLKGGRQHCTRTRGGRIEPLDFCQGGFIFVRKAIPFADPLQVHDVVGSELGELIEGRLELCEQPEWKISSASGGNKLKRKPKMARAYLPLGHAAPRLRPGLRLGRPQGLQPGFRPRQPGPEIGLAH